MAGLTSDQIAHLKSILLKTHLSASAEEEIETIFNAYNDPSQQAHQLRQLLLNKYSLPVNETESFLRQLGSSIETNTQFETNNADKNSSIKKTTTTTHEKQTAHERLLPEENETLSKTKIPLKQPIEPLHPHVPSRTDIQNQSHEVTVFREGEITTQVSTPPKIVPQITVPTDENTSGTSNEEVEEAPNATESQQPNQSSGSSYNQPQGKSLQQRISNMRQRINQAKKFSKGANEARAAFTAARTAATAAEGLEAIAATESNPVGWIITAVIIIALVFIMFIIMILPAIPNFFPSSPPDTGTGNGSGVSILDQCVPHPTDNAQLANVLLNTYGIIVIDKASITDVEKSQKLQTVYTTMCVQDSSPTYKKLLGATAANPQYLYYAQNVNGQTGTRTCGLGLSGMKNDGGNNRCRTDMSINANCSTVGWCQNPANAVGNRFVISHELGHIILRGNISGIGDKFYQFYRSDQANPHLPTSNCQIGSYNPSECFADMIGEYDTYPQFKFQDTLFNPTVNYASYNTTSYYNFAKTNIFDNIDFYAPGSSGGPAGSGNAAVISLFNALNAACPHKGNGDPYVDLNDVGCIKGLSSQQAKSALAIAALLTSVQHDNTLQCVGFAVASSIVAGYPTLPFMNANSYAFNKVPGYRLIPFSTSQQQEQLQPGDFMIWKNPYQHIAYVLQANYGKNGNLDSFKVLEASGGSGTIGYHIYYFNHDYHTQEDIMAGWLRPS